MPFDTFTLRMRQVADSCIQFCHDRYGKNKLVIEKPIADSIRWRPTFYFNHRKSILLAVEVEEVLYPDSLKIAALDILKYNHPISIIQACPLEVFQDGQNQTNINQLKKDGFGIWTVNDAGLVEIQNSCIPIAQFISPDELERSMESLPKYNKLKVEFRDCYETYKIDTEQGLQKISQIVERIINDLTLKSYEKKKISSNPNGTANKIDILYNSQDFIRYRAVLGAARNLNTNYRNPASHPPKDAKESAERIRKCRKGFLDAVECVIKLREIYSDNKMKLAVNI